MKTPKHFSGDLSTQTALRQVQPSDLQVFFEQQLDPAANKMAAFTVQDPADQEAFAAHWDRIMGDSGITLRTILYEGEVAGYVLHHGWFGDPEISYWLGKAFWGKGIATQALRMFLDELDLRPLYARVAKDNLASLRVLEKCGFSEYGNAVGYANSRGREIEEALLILR